MQFWTSLKTNGRAYLKILKQSVGSRHLSAALGDIDGALVIEERGDPYGSLDYLDRREAREERGDPFGDLGHLERKEEERAKPLYPCGCTGGATCIECSIFVK